MTITEIQKMDFVEKLQAMELLWDSLLDDESKIESPEWHEDIVRNRVNKIKNDDAKFITIEELKAQNR